jgi:thioredoxin reductase/ferredoxin
MISFISIGLVAAAALLCWTVAQLRARSRPRRSSPRRVAPLVHSINDDRCTGCEACTAVCPTEVLELVAHKSRVVRAADCIECEQCALVCPTTALVMHRLGTAPPPIRLPRLDDYYQAAPGLYLIGEAAGKPLIKNASNLGRVVVEHMVRAGLRAGGAGDGVADTVDVLIVGSGPAGLSAALSCIEHGLSYCVLEKDDVIAPTIARYPRGKLVMAEPYDVRCLGLLPVFDAERDELLARWHGLVAARGVAVQTRRSVERLARLEDGSFVVESSDGSARFAKRARRVVLSVGTRGRPRRLGVPGEELPHVTALLDDAEAHAGQRVLVVGGGDSAVEAACALATTAASVTLSYRGQTLSRCKAKNRQALATAVELGHVEVVYGSQVVAIAPGAARLVKSGATHELACDYVLVCIGADAPVRWLEQAGVSFTEQPHLSSRGPTDVLLESLIAAAGLRRHAPAPSALVIVADDLGAA